VAGRRRVIVGVSGSVRSLPALRQAAVEARTRDAVLVAVHAWTPPGGGRAGRRCSGTGLRQVGQVGREAAWHRLRGTLDAAFGGMPAGVDVEPLVVRGDASFVLVHVSGRDDDLLVVGAGRRGALRRLWCARISRYCVARAACPVLVVPPAALAREMGRRRRGWVVIRRARARGR